MKQHFKIYLCTMALILPSMPVIAFDLVTAYQNALNYNADYLAAIAKNQAAQEFVILGRAALLPQISGSAGVNENYLNAGMNLYYHQLAAGANLQQVLVDFGKFSQCRRGKFAVILADLQLLKAKDQLIVKVTQAYFDVLYVNDTLDAILRKKAALTKQLELAQHAFDIGIAAVADINDAKAGLDLAVAQEIQAVNDLINKKSILHNITGLNADLVQPLVKDINLIKPNKSAVQWSELARVNNLDNRIYKLQTQMNLEDISITKSGHKPILTLQGSYLYQGNAVVDSADAAANYVISQSANVPGSFLSGFASAAIGLQLNIPIYSGGGISSKVRQAIDNYEAAQQQSTAILRQTDQNIQNAFWQVENGIEIVKAQTQALKSARLKLSSDKVGYQLGVRNSIDLVNSETNYAQTIQNYNQARYQYLLSQLQLKYLAGEVDLDYLKQINQNIAQ